MSWHSDPETLYEAWMESQIGTPAMQPPDELDEDRERKLVDATLIICQHCGLDAKTTYNEEVKARLIINKRCFNCDFWVRMVEQNQEPENILRWIVTSSWRHHRIGSGTSNIAKHRGSYGRTYTIEWLDTTRRQTVTNDLWSQGQIPERWRHLFEVNATLREGT